ncbi:MAG: ATP synthase F1 subunit gamma [Candidatus Margulisiibacteriota bacterium]
MSKLNEIKQRITGVKKTKKITQALNMVAAAKFRKAHIELLSARPYSDKLYQLINDLCDRLITKESLFFANEGQKTGVIVIAGDRGLCGSFNNNIFKKTESFAKEIGQDIELILIGTKTCQYFKKQILPIVKEYLHFFDQAAFENARNVSEFILEQYLNHNWKEVFVVYNDFKSAITQKTLVKKILPVEENVLEPSETPKEGYCTDYIYEPGDDEVIKALLTKHTSFQLYRIFLESSTSEQAARMTAMEAATDNAVDMINRYTLRYNRVRQAVITTEIAEIVGGAEALA